MNNRWFTTMLGGSLLAMLAVVGIVAVTIVNERKPTVIAAVPIPDIAAAPKQVDAASPIEAIYSGGVALTWVLAGVHSDPLPTPTPQPQGAPAAMELGAFDLGLQLIQTGNVISGYVNLERTLIVSIEHTLADGTKTGPTVTGAFDGTNLALTSQRFETRLDGKPIERQFRLTGKVDAADQNLIRGEYRETFWGYTDQPTTAMGAFTLQRQLLVATIVGNSNSAPNAVADVTTTSQGTAVTINVLANDSDPNADALTVTAVSQPQFGTATTNGQTVTYTPNATFVGVDSFSYFVSDGKGSTVAATVTVTVTGTDQPGGNTIHLPLIQR
jgi:hypothetical protein